MAEIPIVNSSGGAIDRRGPQGRAQFTDGAGMVSRWLWTRHFTTHPSASRRTESETEPVVGPNR